MYLKIYAKPKCIQCKMTNNLVQSLQINNCKEIVDPETKDGQNIIEKLKSQYHVRQMPFVQVFDHQKLINSWTGFQPDKIKQYRKEA